MAVDVNRSHLTPEPRTDKNGVTSVRWVKPPSVESKKGMPAPAAVKEAKVSDRLYLESVIREGGYLVNTAMQMLNQATPKELAVIAEAVKKHGEMYVESLVESAFRRRYSSEIADVAVVYSPELFNKSAMIQYNALAKAIRSSCSLGGCGQASDALHKKDPAIIERTRNFVRFMDAVDKLPTRKAVNDRMISLALGDTGRNPDEVFEVMTRNELYVPEQIEFILDGVAVPLADGAL